MNPFKYERNTGTAGVILKKETADYLQYEVRIESASGICHPENSVLSAEYYLPKGIKKAPLLVLVHGMGDYSVIPCRLLARKFVQQNIACFIPYLTIHSRRLPAALKPNMPYLTPDEWFGVYRVSVIDILQALDWAQTRNELDGERLYLAGISFGGFVSTIGMAIDERISGGVFIVTGGNANKISWSSRESRYRKRYHRTPEEHFRILESYRIYLEQVNKYGFENVAAEHISFLTDPLTFAGYLKDRPVLMINAEKDKYIPPECVDELWQAIDRPEIRWFPTGHVTLWFYYQSIYRVINRFLISL